MFKRCAATGLLALSLCVHARPDVPRRADAERKAARVERTGYPPVLDGVLDEMEWRAAGFVDDLKQVQPVEYAEPSERTQVYLLYDDEALYVGARLCDTQPELITANILRQNSWIVPDDAFYVTLDPFKTGRAGYFFGTNPNGVRYDGTYRNVSEIYDNWDGIFYAAAGYFEGGGVAEFTIPFKTLSFDPNTDRWGLNFSRSVARKNERIAWSSRKRSWDPSVSGLAIGFDGIQQGAGLDIAPSATYRTKRTFAGHIAYTYRPLSGRRQSIYSGIEGQRIESIGEGLQSQLVRMTFASLTNQTGDSFSVRSNLQREVLETAFVISPGIAIPIDDEWVLYEDRWTFLSGLKWVTYSEVMSLVNTAAAAGRIVGVRLPIDDDSNEPWRLPPSRRPADPPIRGKTLPARVKVALGNQFFVDRSALPAAPIARCIRLAAFQNPEFYAAQACACQRSGSRGSSPVPSYFRHGRTVTTRSSSCNAAPCATKWTRADKRRLAPSRTWWCRRLSVARNRPPAPPHVSRNCTASWRRTTHATT